MKIIYSALIWIVLIPFQVFSQQLAKTPPMGWNSWDGFCFDVTEQQVKATADFMEVNLKSAGWEYVVIDMGWYFNPSVTSNEGSSYQPAQSIDEWGRLIPDVTKYPSSVNGEGFKPMADYIHSKGLKFGIHIMRGIPWKAVKQNTTVKGTTFRANAIDKPSENCEWSTAMVALDGNSAGMQAYYNSIFELYASWGVDFVKVDDIAREFREKDMLAINKAIINCGRPIVLSLSPGAAPINHASFFMENANMYRIANDFWDNWDFFSQQLGYCNQWYNYITPGHWPDADMLPFGKLRVTGGDAWIASLLNENQSDVENELSRFTNDEKQSVFSLWCIFRSPLMYGGYLPESDPFSINLLKNEEVISVNQNSSNNKPIINTADVSVWTADVPGQKAKYVAMFNLKESTANVTINLTQLGISESLKVRDLWSHTDLGTFSSSFTASLPSHGSGLYKIEDNSLHTSVTPFANESQMHSYLSSDNLILVPDTKITGSITVQIVNVSGSIVKSAKMERGESSYSMNVTDLKNGIYIVRTTGKNINMVSKIIIQR